MSTSFPSKNQSTIVGLLVAMVLFLANNVAVAQANVLPPAPGFGEVIGRMLPMFVLVFFIFYFMVLKPQQKRLKEHENLVSGLKKGDSVVTSGGLFGRVAGVEKDSILIEVAPGVKVRVEPSHISKKHDKALPERSASAA